MRISDWSSDVCSSDLSRGDVDWGGCDQGYDDGYRDGYDDGNARDDAAPPPPPGYDQRYEGPPPEVRFGPRAEIVQPLDGPALAYPPHVVTRCVGDCAGVVADGYYYPPRSEEHTSSLQSLMRISYAVFCLTKKITI